MSVWFNVFVCLSCAGLCDGARFVVCYVFAFVRLCVCYTVMRLCVFDCGFSCVVLYGSACFFFFCLRVVFVCALVYVCLCGWFELYCVRLYGLL